MPAAWTAGPGFSGTNLPSTEVFTKAGLSGATSNSLPPIRHSTQESVPLKSRWATTGWLGEAKVSESNFPHGPPATKTRPDLDHPSRAVHAPPVPSCSGNRLTVPTAWELSVQGEERTRRHSKCWRNPRSAPVRYLGLPTKSCGFVAIPYKSRRR